MFPTRSPPPKNWLTRTSGIKASPLRKLQQNKDSKPKLVGSTSLANALPVSRSMIVRPNWTCITVVGLNVWTQLPPMFHVLRLTKLPRPWRPADPVCPMSDQLTRPQTISFAPKLWSPRTLNSSWFSATLVVSSWLRSATPVEIGLGMVVWAKLTKPGSRRLCGIMLLLNGFRRNVPVAASSRVDCGS